MNRPKNLPTEITLPWEASEAPVHLFFLEKHGEGGIYYLKRNPKWRSPLFRVRPKRTTPDSLTTNALSLATRKKYS